MKILTLTALTACALASSALGGQTVASSSKQTYEPAPALCFGDREWQIDLFGVYSFTDSSQADILGDHAWGGGLGINYYFHRMIGIGVEGMIMDPRGGRDAIGTAALNVFVRFPNDSACFAPYIYGGVGGIFNAESLDTGDIPGRDDHDDDSFLTGHAGVGVEYRFNRNFGVFVDGRYTIVDESSNNFATVRTGFRFAF